MPAKAPPISRKARDLLRTLGQRIRGRRRELKVTMTAAAESARMSRMTWHRIEKGEPSVAAGTYASALAALNLHWSESPSVEDRLPVGAPRSWIPARVSLHDYPELKRLAWQVHGVETLSPTEALSIYERNWRHVDETRMSEDERALVHALREAFSGGQDV